MKNFVPEINGPFPIVMRGDTTRYPFIVICLAGAKSLC